MIDIITEQELDLKNITQIGTPGEQGKIYVEDSVYARIHQDEYCEKRVFLLLGHTTSQDGVYSTFIEATVLASEVSFEENTPVWTNRAWNEVYQTIKNQYEEHIIVGWAIDLKGVTPKITEELETMHREHFGGVHQVLFLTDTADGQEYFYVSKNNHLYRKEGFYIYYNTGHKYISELKNDPIIQAERIPARRTVSQKSTVDSKETLRRGSYRQQMLKQSVNESPKRWGVALMAVGGVAVLLLVMQIRPSNASMQELKDTVSVFMENPVSDHEHNSMKLTEFMVDTETLEETQEQEGVPVEKVDGKIPHKKTAKE